MKVLENGIAVIEGDSHLSRWIEETNRLDHDLSLVPILCSLIKEGDHVVDAGAFIGDHTIAYLRTVGKFGKVYAFEPNPEAFECLKHNCPDAIHFNCGLSDRTCLLSLKKQVNAGATYAVPGSEVLGIPLDSMDLDKLDYLKMDIEGMEMKAIKGAEITILKCKPIICLEINRGALERNAVRPEELISYVEGLGYNHKKVYETDSLEANQYDLLFIPKKEL